MPFTVYILKSLKTGRHYVGMTEQSMPDRMNDHNWGRVNWSSSQRPFELAHHEVFESKALALKREKFFKTGKGRQVIRNIVGENLPPKQ
jgi:putative endonuclease